MIVCLFRMQAVNSQDKLAGSSPPMGNPPSQRGLWEGAHQTLLEHALGVNLSCCRHIQSQGERLVQTDVA